MLRSELQDKLDKHLSNLLDLIQSKASVQTVHVEAEKICDEVAGDRDTPSDKKLLSKNWQVAAKHSGIGYVPFGDIENDAISRSLYGLFQQLTQMAAGVDLTNREREQRIDALAAELRGYLGQRGFAVPRGQDSDAIPLVRTPLQIEILDALKGRALKLLPLAAIVSKGDTRRLYRSGGLKELRQRGLVQHKHSVGFYRPDALPPTSL